MVGIVMQFTACFVQLMIIVGLCFDEGKSASSKLFKVEIEGLQGSLISLMLFMLYLNRDQYQLNS